MIPQILPKLGYGAAAIGVAFSGFGVCSFVGGRLVLEVLSLITIWHVIDWRPSYKFDKKAPTLKTLKYLSFIAIPVAFGIAVIAWDFVKVVYGDKWLPTVAALPPL